MELNYFSREADGTIKMHGFEKIMNFFYVRNTDHGVTIHAEKPAHAGDCGQITVSPMRDIKDEALYALLSGADLFDKRFITVESSDFYVSTHIEI